MKAFMEWVRHRFTMVDLMHLTDIEDETLKLMLFQNGPSRDEFMKILVYKLLLDIDPEDSRYHNLERVFVTFGLLDKDAAQQFVKGNMSNKLHMATWKIIIESLIPITTITAQQTQKYNDLMTNYFEKSSNFRIAKRKKFLPPELIPKLKDQIILNENCETIEDISDQLIDIINKPIRPDGNIDFENLSNSKEKTNNIYSDFMDVNSIKKEIDQYIQTSKDSKLVPINNESSVRMSQQEFLEKTENLDLIPTDLIESKVESIYELLKAEHDLQILSDSLAADQTMLDSHLNLK